MCPRQDQIVCMPTVLDPIDLKWIDMLYHYHYVTAVSFSDNKLPYQSSSSHHFKFG